MLGVLLTRLRRLVSHELALLLMAAALVLGLWGFAAIADEVTDGETQPFDEAVMRALRTGDDPADAVGPDWLESWALDITALGGVAVFALLTIAASIYLLLIRKPFRVVEVLVATAGGALVVFYLKEAFDRPRPDVVPHLTAVHTLSFPSGHAAMSAAIYLTLGVLLAQASPYTRVRLFFMLTALVLTLLVGCSRVYLGVHYPTDVLAGWCLGLAWAALVWVAGHLLNRWLRPREPVLTPDAETA